MPNRVSSRRTVTVPVVSADSPATGCHDAAAERSSGRAAAVSPHDPAATPSGRAGVASAAVPVTVLTAAAPTRVAVRPCIGVGSWQRRASRVHRAASPASALAATSSHSSHPHTSRAAASRCGCRGSAAHACSWAGLGSRRGNTAALTRTSTTGGTTNSISTASPARTAALIHRMTPPAAPGARARRCPAPGRVTE
jgi:hypothetical protein